MKATGRMLIGYISFLMALLVVGTLWWEINGNPVVSIPKPKLPVPNAYDYYVKAGKLMGYDGIPMEASLTEKQAFVKQHMDSLKLLRQGFAYECHQPSVGWDFRIGSMFRELAKLLVIEGQVKAVRGRWGDAAESSLDAVQLGHTIVKGAPVIGMLVSVACEAIGRSLLWKTVDHLTAREAHNAARRLEAITSHQVPFVDTLQVEAWNTETKLMEGLREPRWWQAAEPLKRESEWHAELRALLYGKRKIIAGYTQYMDAVVSIERSPNRAQMKKPFPPGDPICRVLCDYDLINETRFVRSRNETTNALLTVTLALRAYISEHGTYPARLDSLVPSYLKKIPEDPFTENANLRYRLLGTKYLLYSVGPDRKDDGGKPIYDPRKSGKARYRFDRNSKGDIVAGVNVGNKQAGGY